MRRFAWLSNVGVKIHPWGLFSSVPLPRVRVCVSFWMETHFSCPTKPLYAQLSSVLQLVLQIPSTRGTLSYYNQAEGVPLPNWQVAHRPGHSLCTWPNPSLENVGVVAVLLKFHAVPWCWLPSAGSSCSRGIATRCSEGTEPPLPPHPMYPVLYNPSVLVFAFGLYQNYEPSLVFIYAFPVKSRFLPQFSFQNS